MRAKKVVQRSAKTWPKFSKLLLILPNVEQHFQNVSEKIVVFCDDFESGAMHTKVSAQIM